MSDEVTDEQLVRLAVVICRGKLELRAATYAEKDWCSLVEAGLLKKSFTSWDRRQYTLMANKSTETVVMENIARAASIAADYDLHDVASFLIEYMSPGNLPELLSHENEDLRNAASVRLDELLDSISGKNEGPYFIIVHIIERKQFNLSL